MTINVSRLTASEIREKLIECVKAGACPRIRANAGCGTMEFTATLEQCVASIAHIDAAA